MPNYGYQDNINIREISTTILSLSRVMMHHDTIGISKPNEFRRFYKDQIACKDT